MTEEPSVLVLHGEVTPYRLPLFEELAETCDLEVLFCSEREPGRRWDPDLDDYSFDHEILGNSTIGPLLLNPSLPFRLAERRPDVLVVSDQLRMVPAATVCLLFSLVGNTPLIVWTGTTEDSDERLDEDHPLHRVALGIDRLHDACRWILYRFSSAFVAYSQRTEDHLVRRGVDAARIHVGGQVTPAQLLPEPTTDRADPTDDTTKIGFLGYLKKRKGVEILLDAFGRIGAGDAVLVIAGSGPQEDRLRTVAEGMDGVRFVGYVEGQEKADFYAGVDIFVNPTLHDPSSHVVNEAMYYGRPVIVTSADGASEKIDGNGIVVEPNDPQALAAALRSLIDDPARREEFSERSKELSKRHTDPGFGAEPFRNAIDSTQKNDPPGEDIDRRASHDNS